ncbi:protein TIC 20-v, chloroplastic-like [Henckelia pumila]|uniref:protein TIC 20-v, chloroplastic-like n=1 Tax=Henckelia pumila TaxID=405737 RepID=UPI003C6E51D5
MAMTNLFSTPSATFVKQPLHTLSSSNPNLRFSPLNFRAPHLRKPRTTRKFTVTSESKDSNSADAPDRLISAITYFYPFFDGIQYGKYVITQFSPFQTAIQPLVPAIKIFKSFPFNGFLVFLTLYFVVVRNPNFSRIRCTGNGAVLSQKMSAGAENGKDRPWSSC